MSDRSEDIIQAQQAPLSHLSQSSAAASWRQYLDWRVAAIGALVLAAAAIALLWQPQSAVVSSARTTTTDTSNGAAPAQAPARTRTTDEALAPFAETQRQRVREKAQAALASFVEKQIVLEEQMQVASWGAVQLDEAMALAKEGDTAFLKEKYDASLAAYEQAVARIDEVLDLGGELFDEHLDEGLASIAQLQPEAAVAALEQALTIKPEDPDALAAMQRARQLPEIIGLLRTAKNHELSGRYGQALSVYDRIQQMDPDTTGLEDLRAVALAGRAGNDLSGFISQGFSALENQRFEQARAAFNNALKLEADNAIALGGLQQVAQRKDLATINALQKRAEQALAEEQWQSAIDAYDKVLALDANVQFALNGRASARAHLRAQNLLEKIRAEPQKLSSQKLYLDAVAILDEARTLEHAGSEMQALTDEVDELLTLYRDPVDVVLLSDNATRIIMSNVGELGFFERKTLSLRPGQYTIRGSQNGCRDIYLSVDILPGIAPLDLSCPEQLSAGN